MIPHMSAIIMVLLLRYATSQISISPYVNFPTYPAQANYYYINLNHNGSEVFISTNEANIFKVIRLNVSSPLQSVRMGEYIWSGFHTVPQNYGAYTTFIIKDYLITSSS